MKSRIAVALGRRGKGKPKTLTPAQRQRCGQRGAASFRRWHKQQGHSLK